MGHDHLVTLLHDAGKLLPLLGVHPDLEQFNVPSSEIEYWSKMKWRQLKQKNTRYCRDMPTFANKFPVISLYVYDLSIVSLFCVLRPLVLQGFSDVCNESVLVLHHDLLAPDGVGEASDSSGCVALNLRISL